MQKKSKTVVFFGSGPVAAASLRSLAASFAVTTVITKPAPEHHRGSVPVVELAKELGLTLFTPENRTALTELFRSESVIADVGLVIDYGIIIDEAVIDTFPLGIINSHFSLLPEWRGADPIAFSVLSGQKQTGISLMLIAKELDEGPLLSQSTFDIPDGITTPELTDALIELSNKSLETVLPLYLDGKIQPQPQEAVTISPQKKATYSRKLTKGDGILDWTKPAEVLEREIRAFAGWPKSTTQLGGKDVVILQASTSGESGKPGSLVADKHRLIIHCGIGSLEIERLQPAGKQAMPTSAFLAGYRSQL